MQWTNQLKHVLHLQRYLLVLPLSVLLNRYQKWQSWGCKRMPPVFPIYYVQSRQHCVVEKSIILESDRPVNPGSIPS